MGYVRANIYPLENREDHNSIFWIKQEGPLYLPVRMNKTEWPHTLVLCEPFDENACLLQFKDGIMLELVKVPGNRPPNQYDHPKSVPLLQYKNCRVIRRVTRPMAASVSGLELVVVIDCRIKEL